MIWRYPGGKAKLLISISEHLYPIIKKSESFSEAFTGGGSVLIQVAKDFPHAHLAANDKDVSIYSFWKLLENNRQSEINQFYSYVKIQPTVNIFNSMREKGMPDSLPQRAYYGVFMNRTCFSGIATSGPIGGYEQKSKWKIDCRYNAERIIKEFEELRGLFAGRLVVSNSDCIEFLKEHNNAVYLDPPYFVKGAGLYPVHMQPSEHEALAKLLKKRRDWVLSYDICPEIDAMYSWANRIPLDARYSINDHKKTWVDKKEYIILPK